MTFDTVAIAPFIPLWVILIFVGLIFVAAIYGVYRRAPGIWWRTGALLIACLLLLNPSLVAEDRTPLTDHALVLVDRSPSNKIAEREDQTERAVTELTTMLNGLPNLVSHVVQVDSADLAADGTRMIGALQKALIDLPRERIAGILMITDGQVHDAGAGGAGLAVGAPVHTLLTGKRGERDRRLVVETAPRYGIVGESVIVTVVVEDQEATGRSGSGNAGRTGRLTPLTLQVDDRPPVQYSVEIGVPKNIEIELTHGGPTIFDLRVDAIPGELTTANNRVVLLTQGVRDRLRVLLISGEPHSGERTWRNLLKSDPSVDLVHFTILRPPEKQDGTPIRELSLIAFPTRELFQTKLHDFDLIIFDRYRRRGVLPDLYLNNVVDYVEGGGAVLAAAGPAFASPLSLFRTPLESVLPSHPTGSVLNRGFRPELTKLGKRHPVTADLQGAKTTPPGWGPWFRLIDSRENSGNVLMRGLNDKPVLILDRVGEGRVAQLLSDHAWLWAKQYRGGGPQAELLRKLSHWLMREPDLEEESLQAIADGNQLRITRRSLDETPKDIEVTTPTGNKATLPTVAQEDGTFTATLPLDEPGLYRLTDGLLRTVAAAGDINPREFADLRATEQVLSEMVSQSGGEQFWLDDGTPTIRQVRPERDAYGRDWLGLRQNGQYIVSGIEQYALLPPWLALVLAVGLFMTAWYREGR